MTTTAASRPTYRKAKNGKWVAFGPRAAFLDAVMTPEGLDSAVKFTVDVVKKNGEVKTERIESLGKSFMVDGIECCYAYLVPTRAPSSSRRMTREERDDFYGCGCPGANGIDMCTRCGHSPM